MKKRIFGKTSTIRKDHIYKQPEKENIPVVDYDPVLGCIGWNFDLPRVKRVKRRLNKKSKFF